MLVVAGVESEADADPSTGWTGAVDAGTMHPRVILQTQVWVDTRAQVHRLVDMDRPHRADVAEMLSFREDDLVLLAGLGVARLLAQGALSSGEARERLRALGALGRGWMGRTPLVRRMWELNGGGGGGGGSLAVPSLLGRSPAGGATTTVRGVADEDGGCWVVQTETSTYVVDLVRRTVLRSPGAVRSSHVRSDGRIVVVNRHSFDGRTLRLIHLMECRVGSALRATVLVEGVECPLRSTLVVSVEPVAGGLSTVW